MKLSDKYSGYFTAEYMMGPCTLRLLEEAMLRHPPRRNGRILDLGCGTGLSSLFAARETGGTAFAVDLWISAADNYRRIARWGMESSIIPIHANALELPFADEYFDTVISVDAYHYFAGNREYFPEKLLPLIKRGGLALIAVPGLKAEFAGSVPREILDWAGDDHTMFHSCDWWREAIGEHPEIQSSDVWEMECFDIAWREWFASGHKYAPQDRDAFEKGVGKYLNFVGIAVRKR